MTHRLMENWTVGQTDDRQAVGSTVQTGREMEKWMDICIDVKTHRQMKICVDTMIHRQIDRWKDRCQMDQLFKQAERLKDEWRMHRCEDRRTDGQLDS